MKTYSVQQIAKILKTNPETVRRWIRDGKLKATQDSKKEGNVVTQAQLEAFLKSAPKYASLFAESLVALSPLVGFAGAVIGGGIISSLLLKYAITYRNKTMMPLC